MTALKAHEVARWLNRPDLVEGIFLCYGPDNGLVRETAQRLVQHFTAGGDEGLIVFDGPELDADPGRLAVEAGMPSMFGGRRVIRVRNAGKGLAPTLNELKDDPNGAAIILEAGNLAPRDTLRALVETARLGRALPCYPDSDETLLKVIEESFAKAGIAADKDVSTTLRDILGNDREVTRRELEKLELFAAESKRLTRNDILALCADNAMLVLDEVADALGTGHASRLETSLNQALAASVNPQQLLSSAVQHITQLRRWRAEVDAGKSPGEVLEGARPKPHFSRKSSLEQQLRLWSDDALAAASNRLYEATAEARKTYSMQETVLRRALLAVCLQAAER